MEDVGTFMLLQVELYLKVVPLDWIIFSEIIGYLTNEDNKIHMFSIPSNDEEQDTQDLTDSEENDSEEMKRNIEIVMAQATVSHGAALEALIKCNRDILDAINELCPDRDPTMPLLTVSDVSTDDAEDDEYDSSSEDEVEDDESNIQDKSQLIETHKHEMKL